MFNLGASQVSELSWSGQLVIVQLPGEPQTSYELDTVIRVAVSDAGFNIIIDFSDVETIRQMSLCRLVILQRMLNKSARHLGFCHTSPTIRRVLRTHKIGRFDEADWHSQIRLVPAANPLQGGSLLLGKQDQIDSCERRRYRRLNLSKSLRIMGLLWHRSLGNPLREAECPHCWQCRLIDVSEGGAQVVIDVSEEPSFNRGQYINLRFSPVFSEAPVTFEGIVREILPTADCEYMCLGLQFVGLGEDSPGRRSLKRLCASDGRYFAASASSMNNATAASP